MSASLTSGTYPRAGASHGPLAAVSSSFARWGGVLWRGLTALGASRARAHLLSVAAQYEHTNPSLARQLRDSVGEIGRG
ncbi:hypothetical protein [Aquabacterium sp. OR-4]|uniref:hypothetical protein n=1 Tax=Aquabacterium sp. OR-4 TaxID=2978127 RepID=UPI0021B18420|nr:hypothetical protein [Aquabacterium sp. OR-4]MDT7838765.1 hypothetical protein [Aquabacterium sp. OR-4]